MLKRNQLSATAKKRAIVRGNNSRLNSLKPINVAAAQRARVRVARMHKAKT